MNDDSIEVSPGFGFKQKYSNYFFSKILYQNGAIYRREWEMTKIDQQTLDLENEESGSAREKTKTSCSYFSPFVLFRATTILIYFIYKSEHQEERTLCAH
jgi:hypothetical protein